MSDTHIHILYGSDEFAIGERINALRKGMGDPTTADMNTTRLDARNMSEDALNNAVNAMPFLAKQRLVILDNIASRYDKADKQKKFLEFLGNAPDTALMVLPVPGEIKEKEKAKNWLLKWVSANGARANAQEFNLPKRGAMPGWIIKEAEKQGGRMHPNAAARLAEMVGEDTRIAALEITKLLTYVNFKHPVEVEDVEAVSIVSAQADVFAMVDALGAGNARQAQKLLLQLMQDEDVFSLFGMIVRQFRLLLQAREVMDERGGVPEVIASLHLHPFVAEKLVGQARGFRIEDLERTYRHLLEVDEAAKTGVMPLETALEMFVMEVARK